MTFRFAFRVATLVFLTAYIAIGQTNTTPTQKRHSVSKPPDAVYASSPRQPSWATKLADTASSIEVDATIRQARSEAFNDSLGIRPRLDEGKPSKTTGGTGSFLDRVATNPLPIAKSDYVIVGTVSGYQSFLSSDHTTIYTELYVSTEQVLKSSGSEVVPGSTVTILRSGGAVRYSGSLLTFPPISSGREELDLKERYVLFLRSNPRLKAYADVEAWRLENGHALPMDLYQRGAVQTDPKLIRYTQDTESQFLGEIETEIQLGARKN